MYEHGRFNYSPGKWPILDTMELMFMNPGEVLIFYDYSEKEIKDPNG